MNTMSLLPLPAGEKERLEALGCYRILDTLPELPYEDATLLAVQVCDVPIALVTLVDSKREWFKSRIGIQQSELPRYASFCGQAIKDPARVMIVEDASADTRFADNVLVSDVSHVRFYAGAPLVNADGLALGTVCVMDRVVRRLGGQQVEALKAIARQVMAQLEMRRLISDLQLKGEMIQRSHRVLEQHQGVLTAANATLLKQSFTDSLTGLNNRRAFVQHLAGAVSDAVSRAEPLSLVMLDIDHFKRFNDEFGHPAGDEILCCVASILQRSARKNDIVARYGGEEFAILCPGMNEEQACTLADRLCKALSSSPWRDQVITASAGVAALTVGPRSEDVLIQSADQALYQAKSSGRNRVLAYSHLAGATRWLARGSR